MQNHPQFGGAKLALFCEDHLVNYRRDDKPDIPFPGFWDLPGGAREGVESPVDCALRELEEEFSISLPSARILWSKMYPSALASGLPTCFLAARVSSVELARIRFGHEGERWKLMPIADFLSRIDVPRQLQARLAECLADGIHVDAHAIDATPTAPPPIRVSALFRNRLLVDLTDFRPTHIVSLLDPHLPMEHLPAFPAGVRVLQQRFFDGDSPKELPPTEVTVGDIVAFLVQWLECRRGHDEPRLLIHCHMGASRSTAVALLALALFYGPGREAEAFAHSLTIVNKPWPNLNLVKLADQQLGRDGALLQQLLAYRARYPRRLRAYAHLNRLRGGG